MIEKRFPVYSLIFTGWLSILVFPGLTISETQTDTSGGFSPKTYVIHKTSEPLIIDGKPDESAWQQINWTDTFSDIQGDEQPIPRFETKAKMLWDDHYLYIAAQLEEPNIWATIDERDAVIFQENNFEVFIDPDGDTHHYYELELNALGTFWDLMLTKPYRNGGKPINAWDIKGLKIGTHTNGTLNDPSDTDQGWTLEIAIPFAVLDETVHRGKPTDGSQWRLNFSRVEWQTEVENGIYIKKSDSKTGKTLPEDNWVWSPQGVVNMHLPEMWGIVQFSESPPGSNVSFSPSPDMKYEWVLRELYYRQRDFWKKHGEYSEDNHQLQAQTLFDEYDIHPEIRISILDNSFIMSLQPEESDHTFYIREDSRAWKEVKK